ncbi:MAG: hypothetical protein HS113_19110 [Verrucomicrobiales bacterium]|nr:hypothetical protein [Verrucomicrobiales bacterium]
MAPVTVAVASQGSRTRSAAIAEGLTEMLVVALARLGKFDLLESTPSVACETKWTLTPTKAQDPDHQPHVGIVLQCSASGGAGP